MNLENPSVTCESLRYNSAHNSAGYSLWRETDLEAVGEETLVPLGRGGMRSVAFPGVKPPPPSRDRETDLEAVGVKSWKRAQLLSSEEI